jgi:hypothetical protein
MYAPNFKSTYIILRYRHLPVGCAFLFRKETLEKVDNRWAENFRGTRHVIIPPDMFVAARFTTEYQKKKLSINCSLFLLKEKTE